MCMHILHVHTLHVIHIAIIITVNREYFMSKIFHAINFHVK